MKRVDLIRYLESHGVQFLREGGSHSVYVNRSAGKTSTVPRHREIQRLPRSEDLQRFRSSKALTHPYGRGLRIEGR